MNTFSRWGTGKILGLLQTKERKRWKHLGGDEFDFRHLNLGI